MLKHRSHCLKLTVTGAALWSCITGCAAREQGDVSGAAAANTGGAAGHGGNPTGGSNSAGSTQQVVEPGSVGLHRLNTAEYNYTVADVLGTTLQPGDANWAAESAEGFDNIAAVQVVDERQYKRYYDAARAVAADVFSRETLRARLMTCATADDATCIESIVSGAGLKLFRRPLTPEESAAYRKVYADARALGLSHDQSGEQLLTALLASAGFLFRMELDPATGSQGTRELNGYELASRLSYFLWQSAPDERLLSVADELPKTETLNAELSRALSDPKFARSTRAFVGQWLGIRNLPTHAVEPDLFPDWSPALAQGMAEEAYSFFDELARGAQPWTDFLTADVNFVDANLAKLYGLPAPADGMTRVQETSDQRFGFLGMGAFLALSSYDYRTAPTLRGRWILLNLLCTEPPAPPPGVPPLDAMANADASDQNVRARLEQHRTNPACAACHAILDPYGLALENFDAIGRYRSQYGDGTPIDAKTVTAGGKEFSGLAGLVDDVKSQPTYLSCLKRKLFTYSLGRAVTSSDEPALSQIHAQWTSGTPSLQRLIEGLVLADTFRKTRRSE